MYKTSQEYMAEAKETLDGQWGIAAGGTFLYMVVPSVVGAIPVLGDIASLLIGGAVALGVAIFTLALARKKGARIEQLLEGFNDFTRSLATYWLMVIFILLWTLLLIIPGIIAGYGYSFVFYILADDKDIGPMEALKKSKAMLDGHKMRLFQMHLSFLGWFILAICSLGIGFFWLVPYMGVANVKFYEELKGDLPDEDLDYSEHLVGEF